MMYNLTRKYLPQKSCATIYLLLNDPPILNLPSNKEEIAISYFPNIIFSWTPCQLNAINVSYSFELKEILDPTMDPSFAFEVSRSLYKQEDLRSTTLVYYVSKPNLLPGKRYAWRIRAISTSGLGENSVFKNNGYSQVYSFTYTSSCSAPRFLLSEQNWRQINDPKLKFYTFQGQSEGEFSNYVLTPNYDIVQITSTEVIVSSKDCDIAVNNQGVLYGFRLDRKVYCWEASKDGDNKYYSNGNRLENFNTVKPLDLLNKKMIIL